VDGAGVNGYAALRRGFDAMPFFNQPSSGSEVGVGAAHPYSGSMRRTAGATTV